MHQIVQLLVKFQMSIPRDRAASHMQPLAELLLAPSSKGLSPLDYALQQGHTLVAQFLGTYLRRTSLPQPGGRPFSASDEGLACLARSTEGRAASGGAGVRTFSAGSDSASTMASSTSDQARGNPPAPRQRNALLESHRGYAAGL
jgi:hypothetical protein